MMANLPEFVEQMFEAALVLKPAEREAFLDRACADDPELRRTVEELLAEDARVGSFLEHPPVDYLEPTRTNPPSNSSTTGSINPSDFPFTGRLQPGQILSGRFVIVRFIAKGGMGEVYEAEDTFLQSVHIALKILLPHIADDPGLQQRFEREVLLAREVINPCLCPIYDIFRCDQPPSNFLFLTMKLLPGETLAARMRGTTSLSIAEGAAILKQMVSGLAAIHAAGVIHRDIKPNNIMLDGAGSDVRLYITDFGLARAFEAEPSLSGNWWVAGTPDYMAPELYQGRPPSQASDLYALGVVLHQVFTGQKPSISADSAPVIVSPRLRGSAIPSSCVQLIVGCLDKDPLRRCEAFERALDTLHVRRPTSGLWTRRRFAAAAVGAVGAVAGGAYWNWDQLQDLLRPLPHKRFVALLNWPKTSDVRVAPMLTSVLTAIKTELTRFETLDRDLFVISPEDVSMSVAPVSHLREVCGPLGANLVLAATGIPGVTHFQLFLRLLDPSSGQPLREKKLTCALAEITSLPAKAVRAAASLLDLLTYLQSDARQKPGTQSAEAFTEFHLAETLMKKPDDTGLEEAIDSYIRATELDSRYALAHAKLAEAYCRMYAIRRNPGALQLARGNCEAALALDPDLPEGHLAMAAIYDQTGNDQEELSELARALSLDPANPTILVRRAQVYTRLNQWPEAENTLHRVLKDHPNYWLAYNELGFGLHGQARYQEAIQAFLAASVAAPGSAMALANVGGEYLQVGELAEAKEALQKSLVLDPGSDLAAVSTSLALRYQGKSDEALTFARRAVQLNPAEDTNWLELADCYSSLPGRREEAKSAFLRAAREAERHLKANAADGPAWMLLALYKVKSDSAHDALALIEKAESLGAGDMDSQIYKARILELLGRREDALNTLAACFRRGASDFQVVPCPDLQPLRRDPRYHHILGVKSLRPVAS